MKRKFFSVLFSFLILSLGVVLSCDDSSSSDGDNTLKPWEYGYSDTMNKNSPFYKAKTKTITVKDIVLNRTDSETISSYNEKGLLTDYQYSGFTTDAKGVKTTYGVMSKTTITYDEAAKQSTATYINPTSGKPWCMVVTTYKDTKNWLPSETNQTNYDSTNNKYYSYVSKKQVYLYNDENYKKLWTEIQTYEYDSYTKTMGTNPTSKTVRSFQPKGELPYLELVGDDDAPLLKKSNWTYTKDAWKKINELVFTYGTSGSTKNKVTSVAYSEIDDTDNVSWIETQKIVVSFDKNGNKTKELLQVRELDYDKTLDKDVYKPYRDDDYVTFTNKNDFPTVITEIPYDSDIKASSLVEKYVTTKTWDEDKCLEKSVINENTFSKSGVLVTEKYSTEQKIVKY